MLTSNSMTEPIVNRKYGNTFHHQNGPNQRQCVHKPAVKQYKSISVQITGKSSSIYLSKTLLDVDLETGG